MEPVQTSQQKGRRGLGLKLEELDSAALKWDKNMELPLNVPERVEWYQSPSDDPILSSSAEDLWLWIKKGIKKLNIESETNFCEPEILTNIINSKSAFDKLGTTDMIKAR